jgi:cytochrome c553
MYALACAPVVLALVAQVTPAAPAGDDNLFESRIRPLLVARCGSCHGADKTSQGLRVESRQALLEGGDSGPAIVAGDPDASLLIQAVRRTHDSLRMPPREPLSPDEIQALERWVREGAPWPAAGASSPASALATLKGHWAFRDVARSPVPADATGRSSNVIDRWIAHGWQSSGLQPVNPADPSTLLRRLTFDLTGLPPTNAEARVFLEDTRPDALERQIDRLLASPRYGERWGRHWLDVARYADTAGDNADYPIPEARLYRDYVIDAFNGDMPYDQFTREQIAGDILGRESRNETRNRQIIATGFLALSRRYATAPYEFWHLTLEDTIDTFGRAFLGLTLKCARCHDHKFDPVTVDDYTALYGIFSSTRYPWAGGEELHSKQAPRQAFAPLVAEAEARARIDAHEANLQHLRDEIQALEARLKTCADSEKSSVESDLKRFRTDLLHLQRSGLPPNLPGAYAVAESTTVADAPIHLRGDPADRGRVVPRGAIAFLCREPLAIPESASGREQLAEWLTRPDNPLFARVMVNRIWQHHFGRGLAATPSNFGTSGAPPTHPELLDELATRFIESGYSIKSMHRLILASRTWQLSSADDLKNQAQDTGNTTYWRANRRRLDAEAVRDAMLSVAGVLEEAPPAGHPFPTMSTWTWTQHHPFKDIYPTRRRSVYLMTQRLQRHAFLALFDGPDTNTTTDARLTSTVAPQALYALNSPEVGELAHALGDRLRASGKTDNERIDHAYQLCFARPPTDRERDRAIAHLEAVRALAQSITHEPPDLDCQAWQSLARVFLMSSEFLYVD